jgi:hypothetical protein
MDRTAVQNIVVACAMKTLRQTINWLVSGADAH